MNKLFILFSSAYRVQGLLIASATCIVTFTTCLWGHVSDVGLLLLIMATAFLSFWSMMSDENPVMNMCSTLTSMRSTHWSGTTFAVAYLGTGIFSLFVSDVLFYQTLAVAIIIRIANDRRAGIYTKYYRTPIQDIVFYVVVGFGGSLLAYAILLRISPWALFFMICLTLAMSPWLYFKGMRFPRGYVFLSYSERRDRRGQVIMEVLKRALDKYQIFYFDYTREKLDTRADRTAEITNLLKLSVEISDATLEIVSHCTLEHNYESLVFNEVAYAQKVKENRDWVQVEREIIRANTSIPVRFFLCADPIYLAKQAHPNEQKRIFRLPMYEPWSDENSYLNEEAYREMNSVEYYTSYAFRMHVEQFVQTLKKSPHLSLSSSDYAAVNRLKQEHFPYRKEARNMNHSEPQKTGRYDKTLWNVETLLNKELYSQALSFVVLAFNKIQNNQQISFVFLGWSFSDSVDMARCFLFAMINIRALQSQTKKPNAEVRNKLMRDTQTLGRSMIMQSISPVSQSRGYMILSLLSFLENDYGEAMRSITHAFTLSPHEGYSVIARKLNAL